MKEKIEDYLGVKKDEVTETRNLITIIEKTIGFISENYELTPKTNSQEEGAIDSDD